MGVLASCQLLDHEPVEVHDAGVMPQVGQHGGLTVHLQTAEGTRGRAGSSNMVAMVAAASAAKNHW